MNINFCFFYIFTLFPRKRLLTSQLKLEITAIKKKGQQERNVCMLSALQKKKITMNNNGIVYSGCT